MELVVAGPLDAYLQPAPLVDSERPEIAEFAERNLSGCDATEAARRVFHFVRDKVAHSWDAQATRVTRSATDALAFREGICYPKSHLVAALLRRYGIPTALCYQRLTLFDDAGGGHAVHALNAVFLDGSWHRIDARGNKEGVNAEFSLGAERLAFSVRTEFDEVDYPVLYAAPHPSIVATLMANDDALDMYRNGLPDRID